MMLVAMLAIVAVAAAPAIAQVGQEFSESRNKSGAASPKTAISNTGNNVSLCPTGQQVTQTGEVLNEQGVVQYQTKTDDIDFTGSNITVDGASVTATCTQEIRQAAAAGPKAEAKAGKAEAKAAGKKLSTTLTEACPGSKAKRHWYYLIDQPLSTTN